MLLGMKTKLRYLYRAYRYRYRVDTAELRFLRASLQPGGVAVDIGCHKGAYTYWMRRRIGASGLVIAFEPQPRQVAYLRTAFASLPFENVVLVPMGLSDRVGLAQLHVPSGAGQTHAASFEQVHVAASLRDAVRDAEASFGETRLRGCPPRLGGLADPPCSVQDVEVTTLDAFFAEQPRGPDFLKIDVEGHELAVLLGGREVLETHRPTLLVECEARHRPDGDVRPVFDFLYLLGYKGTFFHNGIRRPLAEFDPAVHQRIGTDTDHLPRGYVNNFAFIPSV
jgi:FkbM family methyltransferase